MAEPSTPRASETPGPHLVRDLMTVGVATCSPDTLVVDIARIFLEKELDAIVVLDKGEGHALGVVSREDVVRAYTRHDVRTLKAENIMCDGVPQVPPEIPLAAAAQIMQDRGVRALFIMHHAAGIEYPAAVISYQHLLRHLCARDGEDIRDLGIKAARQSPLEVFIQRREEARKRNSLP